LEVAANCAAILSPVTFGATDTLNGTLTLNGNLTLLGTVTSTTGILQQAGSGTLYIGNGTTAGSLTVSGGNGINQYGNIEVEAASTLTTTGALTTFSGSKLTLDVNSRTNIDSFSQDGGGDLVIQASSPGSYATLTVTADATLSSQFEMDFVGGYTPTKGTTFTVVRAGTRLGTFSNTPADMTMGYTATTVTATYNG
jgi:hypothetical protein